ncbi:MAG: murein hydrolase activator EnvC [Rhizobiaceae bacterium]
MTGLTGPNALPCCFLTALALALMLSASPGVRAPVAMAQEQAGQPDDEQERNRQELAAIEQQIQLTEQQRQALGEEVRKLELDRAQLNTELIAISKRSRQLEARISDSSGKLADLRGEEDGLRASLKERRGILGEVIGALQRLGRNPPPALLVSPQDALGSVRTAILLGAVVPEIRAEADVLAAELAELSRVREAIDEQRAALTADLGALARDEERLNLLLTEKKSRTNDVRQQMAAQTAHSAELAAKAVSLSKLIESLESEIAAARDAADSARKAEAEQLAREKQEVAGEKQPPSQRDFSDAGRISPAIAFEKAVGLLPRPVSGVEVRNYGQADGVGEPSEGLSIATRVSARVTAPADGWVVYAGPFRSYGQLLILNVGSGYHVVMAGMERIDVQLGQFVLAGEPVAVMGARRVASAGAVDVDSSRPVLYVEFRKDGKSIDPSPWWVDPSFKREPDDT